MAEFVYQMQKVRKAVGDKVILDDVTLAFFPGAKIGVLGPNGAGKSTVLKMMAGLDQPSNGEARLSPGFSVGILMQEPVLDETKTVKENVEDGVRELMDVLARYNALNEQMGDPDADFDAIMAEQAPAAWTSSRPRTAGRSTPSSSRRWTRCAARRRRGRRSPVRWGEAPGRAVQAAARGARPAAARRAHQPPRRRVGGLAREAPGPLPGCGPRRHPRPVLPRQRRRVDPRARPRPCLPVRGQLLDVPREEAAAPRGPGQEGRQALQAPQGRARVGAPERQGPPDQVQEPTRALRGDGGGGREDPQARLRGDPDPERAAAGHRSSSRPRT